MQLVDLAMESDMDHDKGSQKISNVAFLEKETDSKTPIVPYFDGDKSGFEEEQAAFVKELEEFYRERNMEYKPLKFYGKLLNCLKLWREVTRLGSYDQPAGCRLPFSEICSPSLPHRRRGRRRLPFSYTRPQPRCHSFRSSVLFCPPQQPTTIPSAPLESSAFRLWRKVARFGGYDQVTAYKLWRQVGESFKPPKTCTSLSWSFQNFYEKTLLEYEKHKRADNVPSFSKYYDSTEEIYLTPGVSFLNKFSTPQDNFKIQMIEFKKSLVQDRLTFLNNASKKELEGLKGIRKKRATYILELREETPEPFKSVDDLRELSLSTKEINAMMAQALGDF